MRLVDQRIYGEAFWPVVQKCEECSCTVCRLLCIQRSFKILLIQISKNIILIFFLIVFNFTMSTLLLKKSQMLLICQMNVTFSRFSRFVLNVL